MTKVYHRSQRQDWATPSWLFRELDHEFGFTIDLAASPENAKCDRYYTAADDALGLEWLGVCWLNPPYGNDLKSWIRKARESAEAGATVVCLVPARTDTAWWHDHVIPAAEVRFLRGRLQFNNTKGGRAPFPTAIVIFRPLGRCSAGYPPAQ